MNRRVDEREWIQYQWDYLVALLGGKRRIEQLAYERGAFTRRRKIESPNDLLRLIFTWAVAERSLQETAALAAESELADLSAPALLGRFSRAEAWLGAILGDLLAGRNAANLPGATIRLVDATSISCRGSNNTERRVHLALDLRTNCTTAIDISDRHGGETLERFTFRAGEIVVADRGYGKRKDVAHAASSGAYFVIRIGWTNLPLEHSDGTPFDLIGALRSLPEAHAADFAVQTRTGETSVVPCRFVAVRKSEPAAERARQQILADARRHGNPQVDLRTLEAAGCVFVVTNLPDEISAESVLEIYRLRWQIEMKFKALKSVLHLGNPPTRSGELLNVYLTAKLIVALLIEEFVYQAESISPWGYPLAACAAVAADASSA
jgi:hypothetical protein